MTARGATGRGLLWAAVLLVATVRVTWAQAPPEAIEYYARDAVGSVRLVFDTQGNVLGRSDYLPFGETWNQSGALPRQRFTGQARDGEAGLDDFNARAYQPLFGRFTRPDPVSGSLFAPQSWNAYAYVQNRPLVATDPSGKIEEYVLEVTVVGTDPGKKKRPAPTNLSPDMAMWVLFRDMAYGFDFLGGGGSFEAGGSTGYANFGSIVSDGDVTSEGEPQNCPPFSPKTSPTLPSQEVRLEAMKLAAPLLDRIDERAKANRWEYGFDIYSVNRQLIVVGPYTSRDPGLVCPPIGSEATGTWILRAHSHIIGGEPEPSGYATGVAGDVSIARKYQTVFFLYTQPGGQRYDYTTGPWRPVPIKW